MDQNGIDAVINDVSDQLAAWYTVFTGKPAVLGPVSAGQVGATQAPAVPTVATVSAQLGAVDYTSLAMVGVLIVVAIVFLKH